MIYLDMQKTLNTPSQKKKFKAKKKPSTRKKKINSKAKGSAGELEWVNFLKGYGYTARRTQQFCGKGDDSADVVCEELTGYHFEVKRTENCSPYKYLAQAIDDAKHDRIPIVSHRQNNKEWIVILRASDFMELVKQKV